MKVSELKERYAEQVNGVKEAIANYRVPVLDRNLLLRAISAAVGSFTFLFGLFQGGVVFYALMFLLVMVSSFEWNQITKGNRWFYLGAVVTIVLPYTSMMYIYMLPHGAIILMWLTLSIWSTDIAAYFVGRSYGVRKIMPTISPNKTWAGLWGGMAFSAVSTLVMSMIFGLFFVPHSLFIGMIIALVAQCGDFTESAIKRWCGVKDSGFIFPGHGGVLDRMDGFIFTAPLVACYVQRFSKFFIS
ncbi:phosphatidate cytidylyltransferase [Anaplasma platys]|nr:phosphatidate cytidylyltransferase [Anaplasma platys]